MTLAEWGEKHGVRVYDAPTVRVFTRYFPSDHTAIWELFRLSDYRVASALSGPSYFLTCRKEGTE